MKKNNILFLMAAVVASGAYTACTKSAASPKGIEAANLDTTVSPKVDFYEYACGGWMKANPLKPEYSRYGTFDELGENNREQLKELVLGLDPNAADGTNAQKVRDLYAMGMDSLRLNEEGAAPLAKDLATIAAANRDSLVELMATMPGLGIFFGTGVSSDLADSNVNTMYWGQGGLGLGDRDYYTEKSERNDKILAAYRTYLETVASLAGYDKAAASRLASNVIKLETTLAADQMTRTQQRDIAAQYNVRAVADLDKEYPSVNLKRYFELQNLNVDTIIVDSPKYYATVAKALAEQPEEVLRDYAAASYISSAAPYLSDDFINADFKLSQVLSGVEEQRPRWKRALSVPNSVLGEVVGQLYVEKYFPESSKERMLTLVGNLQESLGEHIDSLTWMSDTTKMRAKEKLASFRVKIGYPDNWRDY